MSSPQTSGRGHSPSRANGWICWATLALAIGLLSACGDSEETEVDTDPAYVVAISPRPGSSICEGQKMSLVFNRDPGLVESQYCVLEPASQTGTARTFLIGGPPVDFTWGGVASLTVDYWFMSCHGDAPSLVEAFPRDEQIVALDALVAAGIVLTFDEPIGGPPGHYQPEFIVSGPDDFAWPPPVNVQGATVTLGPPAPGLFELGVTYRVRGEVADGAGDETQIDLEFTIALEE